MNEYTYLFTPFWKVFDVALGLVGIWFMLQPSVLVQSSAAMVFSRERGDKLGLPSAVTTELLTINGSRESLRYETRLLQLIGTAFVVVALVGLLTAVPEALLVSALAVVTVVALTAVLIGGKRGTSIRAAFLNRVSHHVVPWWLVAVLVAQAAAEGAAGTRASVAVAIATLICTGALALLQWLPVALGGGRIAFEREIDRRYRCGRVAIVALFTELPSLVWAGSLDDNGPWTVTAKILVSIAFLCVIVYTAYSSRQLDRDLRRTVADTLV
jgi:hypothetical protein